MSSLCSDLSICLMGVFYSWIVLIRIELALPRITSEAEAALKLFLFVLHLVSHRH